MPELHRLQRRAFLTQYGKGAIGVAVLGPSLLAACSSNGDITLPTTGGSDSETVTVSPEEATPGTTAEAAPDGQQTAALRWERVNMGFVSAYVLARGSEVTIVDAGVSQNLPVFDEALSAIGASWNDVDHVILTHNHGDHVGGLPEIIGVAPKAKIYIGEADIGALGSIEAAPINDGDEIFGLQIIGSPGHTPGHISVFDAGAGLLVAGDAINERDGLVLGPNPDFSSDMTQGNASVLRLAERQYETVVFGHGNPIETGGSDAVIALAQTLG